MSMASSRPTDMTPEIRVLSSDLLNRSDEGIAPRLTHVSQIHSPDSDDWVAQSSVTDETGRRSHRSTFGRVLR